MKRFFPALLVAIFLVTVPAWTLTGISDDWTEIKSTHFDVLTDGGEKSGRELAQQFEQMRSVFAQLFATQITQSVPLQIIALKNSIQVGQYSPLYKGKPVRSTGFYLHSQDRDYIVIDLDAASRWQTVFHEYAHLLLAANLPDLPPWFTEGFAEFYSTIQIDATHAMIGRPPDSALDVLHHDSLMSLATLFSVDHSSAVYNDDSDPRSIFYAQSWLVVHYLWDHNAMEQAQRYFQLVRQHVAIPLAIKQAFDMEAEQFDRALQKYSRAAVEVLRVPLPERLERASFSSRPVTSLDAMTVLAGLHSHQPDHVEQAIGELREILRQDPENAAAHRDLGYIYYYQHNPAAAMPHLQKAAERNPNDWRVHYFWAEMAAQTYDDALAPQIEKEAHRVVELYPEFADGYGLLGFALMVEHRNPEATTAYQVALRLKPQSEIYALNLAELYTLQGKLDEAKAIFLYLQNSGNQVIATAARSHLELMTAPKLKAN